jgi:hypothetical protein
LTEAESEYSSESEAGLDISKRIDLMTVDECVNPLDSEGTSEMDGQTDARSELEVPMPRDAT